MIILVCHVKGFYKTRWPQRVAEQSGFDFKRFNNVARRIPTAYNTCSKSFPHTHHYEVEEDGN